MIRVVTGTAKNKKLILPSLEGFRPVQEIAKSALFSIIGAQIEGSSCLDLFAGSGNLGIEALSRGAAHCDFVDEHPRAAEVIEKNLFNCGFTDNYTIVRKNSIKFLDSCNKQYDLIFADPFYSDTSHKFLIKKLTGTLSHGGLLGFFHSDKLDMPSLVQGTPFIIKTQRRFGQSHLSVLSLN